MSEILRHRYGLDSDIWKRSCSLAPARFIVIVIYLTMSNILSKLPDNQEDEKNI